MRKMLLFVLLALVAVLPLTVVAQDVEPILFGAVLDETGIGAIFAKSQIAGLDLAMEDLNARGGILGRPVSYIRQDAQLNASVGSTIATRMILEDGVDFLIGPTSSGVALAISQVAQEYRVPIAFHTSNTVALSINNWHPYMVQLVPHTTIEGRAAALLAAESGLTRWASIGPDYAFGRDHWAAFAPRLTEVNADASIISEQWPALAERDMNPFLTALEAARPEGIYSSLWGDQLVTFMQAGLDFDLFEEVEFVGLFDLDAMKAMGRDMPEGLLGFTRAAFYAVDTPEMNSFVERYFERNGEYPSDWAIMAYDSVMALAAAAEAAGTTDGDAVSEQLGGLTFMSLRGELTVRECDHMANVGEYVGVTTFSEEYNLPILTDLRYIPAEELWNTCEEIEAIRAGG